VDAHEGRDVAIANVTGAYLHAYMKEFISMRFTGWAVDLLCEVNPEYAPHVVHEGKTKALYVRCNKAIYGCVVSGMLWYKLFSQTLEQHGFTINPYDFCVANATIEGTQCTIVWYVDDTKISHVQPSRKDDRVLRRGARPHAVLLARRNQRQWPLDYQILPNASRRLTAPNQKEVPTS
jgi:hypothetical protein